MGVIVIYIYIQESIFARHFYILLTLKGFFLVFLYIKTSHKNRFLYINVNNNDSHHGKTTGTFIYILNPRRLYKGRGFSSHIFSAITASLYPLVQNVRMSQNPSPRTKKYRYRGNNFKGGGHYSGQDRDEHS